MWVCVFAWGRAWLDTWIWALDLLWVTQKQSLFSLFHSFDMTAAWQILKTAAFLFNPPSSSFLPRLSCQCKLKGSHLTDFFFFCFLHPLMRAHKEKYLHLSVKPTWLLLLSNDGEQLQASFDLSMCIDSICWHAHTYYLSLLCIFERLSHILLPIICNIYHWVAG